MNLTLHTRNTYPLGGILIKNPNAKDWFFEIQNIGYKLQEIEIYPLPDTAANSVWGCFVLPFGEIKKDNIGKNELCQQVTPNLFIAERTQIAPKLTNQELETHFENAKYVAHPDFGWVKLSETLRINDLLTLPTQKSRIITKPDAAAFQPKEVRSFQVQAVAPEDVLKNMEEKIFPKKEKMPDEPLTFAEKMKLEFYRTLFAKAKEGDMDSETQKSVFASKAEAFFKSIGQNAIPENLQKDFENLERRNLNEMQKLLDMLKNDPMEALKYAIPLDEGGGGRGGMLGGDFMLSKRWFDFSLGGGGNRSGSGGGGIDMGDDYYKLRQQYNDTAAAFIAKKEYEKAAFIFLKLLKNPHLAASTLEDGKLYQEAATVYLKHCNNKQKAAECYEKGNIAQKAIELYKELNNNEKVGDLYLTIGKRKDANIYFEKTVDAYKSNNQYIKASLVYKYKMQNAQRAQTILLQGWRGGRDASNCLNNYFENIRDLKELKTEMDSIYQKDVKPDNAAAFIGVIQHEFNKKNELADHIRQIAYEIIADRADDNPLILKHLKDFNKDDKELTKDLMKFSANRRKK
jgi:tetratricopeptide (TPR) repeat protein